MMQDWKAVDIATLAVFKITSFFSAPRDVNIYRLLEEGAPFPHEGFDVLMAFILYVLVSLLSANIRLNLG